MSRKILLVLLGLSIFSLTGCTEKEESFESKVARKFTYVDSANNELAARVEDLEKQLENIKSQVGITDTPSFTEKEINFSSIKVIAKDAIGSKSGNVKVPANTKFNLKMDIMNTTEENISQLTAQAYVTYSENGLYKDRYLVDTRFDVLPTSVRKNIEFKDIPVMGANIEHTLTVIIKDIKGNEITRFEKKIFVE